MKIIIVVDTVKDNPDETAGILNGIAKLFKVPVRVCSRRIDCPVNVQCEGANKIFIDDCKYFEDGGKVI